MIHTTGSDELAGRPVAYGVTPDPQGASAVSWGAILAGAAAAAALSLILLLLGTGLGLSSASPWANQGAGATTLGVSTILWLTFTQLVASGMGGYLAGRLRTRWISVHTDEVYFRYGARLLGMGRRVPRDRSPADDHHRRHRLGWRAGGG
jgi:hypothetical protein